MSSINNISFTHTSVEDPYLRVTSPVFPSTAIRNMTNSKRATTPKTAVLRFDWTNLPPQSEIRKLLENLQRNCSLPIKYYVWRDVPSGMGSDFACVVQSFVGGPVDPVPKENTRTLDVDGYGSLHEHHQRRVITLALLRSICRVHDVS